MGISSDGIVAFGIDLGEELPVSLTNPNDDDEAEFDFDTWVYGRMGVGYDTEATWEDRRKAIDSFPFDLITHCSYDYPMYFLAARGTEVRAKRGFPVELNSEKSSPEKINAMRKFCEEFGIEWKDPSWKVFSVLG